MLRYLDTTSLFDQLERAMHALRQTEIGEPGNAAVVTMQRIATLEKVRPVVSPNLHGDLRKSPAHAGDDRRQGARRTRSHLRGARAARHA
jgi:hypothetical protein